MGRSNVVMKRWLSDKRRLASLVNGALFQGEIILKPEAMKKEDGAQGLYREESKKKKALQEEKYRDIIMYSNDGIRILMAACENQSEIHYAMPVRGMLYDALSYQDQIKELESLRREKKELTCSAEFLSGIKKEDKLIPIITVVFYYGEKKWDGSTELHELLGLDGKEYKKIKGVVSNYKINLIDPAELEDLSYYETDLQMIFGMLRYRKDKKGLMKYIEDHKNFFSRMDEDSYYAVREMMGSRMYLKDMVKNEEGGVDMCQALKEIYQDGVNFGMEEGIRILINSCRELDVSYEKTFEQVRKKYRLTEQETRTEMERNWKS